MINAFNVQEPCHTAGALSRTLKSNKMTTQTRVPQSPGVQKVAKFRPRGIRNRNATATERREGGSPEPMGQVMCGQAQGLDLTTHHRHVHGPKEDRLWGQASVLMFASHHSWCLLLLVTCSPLWTGLSASLLSSI